MMWGLFSTLGVLSLGNSSLFDIELFDTLGTVEISYLWENQSLGNLLVSGYWRKKDLFYWVYQLILLRLDQFG